MSEPHEKAPGPSEQEIRLALQDLRALQALQLPTARQRSEMLARPTALLTRLLAPGK